MLKMLRDVKCVKQASCKFDLSNKSEKRHKQREGRNNDCPIKNG